MSQAIEELSTISRRIDKEKKNEEGWWCSSTGMSVLAQRAAKLAVRIATVRA